MVQCAAQKMRHINKEKVYRQAQLVYNGVAIQ